MPLKLSPLDSRHRALGAKFAEFGGWGMPISYSGIVAEHQAVRNAVGVFDVSHLGKATVRGPGAAAFLNTCLTNDLRRIAPGQAQYTLACDDLGGVIDDLIAYLDGEDDVFLIPNAANTAAVVARLQTFAPPEIEIQNRHDDYAVIAVQGPQSAAVLTAIGLPTDLEYMSFSRLDAMTVCRTGYTGEWGYELVLASAAAPALWDEILAAGEPFGILPCGLGARDTLRTEMGYPLHGHELSTSVTPVQAQVGWAVGWKKETFWGSELLRAEREAGPKQKLWGLKSASRAIPRPTMTVLDASGEAELGVTTSGTFSPSLEIGIGLAYLDAAVQPGDTVQVQIRSRTEPFTVTKPPFVPSHVR
ncbi:MAG: glycine cleavage system aminomethyltransferase GcvT [Propionibacteriaceae bacterium]|jgi:aminomethyltransferase|nr:glycine cleavage system aminomethyltransferase GcvT [Propionibacteriaceae bacterium]